MTKAQENLKLDIEKIDDDITIEKVRIFIMGILTQQGLEQQKTKLLKKDKKLVEQ